MYIILLYNKIIDYKNTSLEYIYYDEFFISLINYHRIVRYFIIKKMNNK